MHSGPYTALSPIQALHCQIQKGTTRYTIDLPATTCHLPRVHASFGCTLFVSQLDKIKVIAEVIPLHQQLQTTHDIVVSLP